VCVCMMLAYVGNGMSFDDEWNYSNTYADGGTRWRR
jgi:hypothetical protein